MRHLVFRGKEVGGGGGVRKVEKFPN